MTLGNKELTRLKRNSNALHIIFLTHSIDNVLVRNKDFVWVID